VPRTAELRRATLATQCNDSAKANDFAAIGRKPSPARYLRPDSVHDASRRRATNALQIWLQNLKSRGQSNRHVLVTSELAAFRMRRPAISPFPEPRFTMRHFYRMRRYALSTALVATLCLATEQSASAQVLLAQSGTTKTGIGWLIVLLGVGLGLIAVCRTSVRKGMKKW
jgi:hypothetical protein